jgi:hypothetical protein
MSPNPSSDGWFWGCIIDGSRVDTLCWDCEELTTYETREVVAVPNSRSMGGV